MKVDEERWVFVKQIPNWVRWIVMNSFFFIFIVPTTTKISIQNKNGMY